jgi:hypothetical protein
MIEVVRILVAAGVGKNASAIWRYLQLTSTAITFLRDSANSSADNKASEVNLQTALERWLGKFERRAKWNFCLTAAMVAADQERR